MEETQWLRLDTAMNEMEGKMLGVINIPTIPQPSRWKNPQWPSIAMSTPARPPGQDGNSPWSERECKMIMVMTGKRYNAYNCQ